ncbi:MAG TPA: DinB family protein [Bryobacteraceae bacterium]|nr:DinB family protein [Bryobacteraceae bacterium]
MPAAKKDSAALRHHLLDLLRGGHAHVDFEKAVGDLSSQLRGKKAKGAPHTAWQLLEHLRIAQWDILEFSRDPKHVSPKWPEGYWPKTEAPPSPASWNNSIRSFRADLKGMIKLVADEKNDLFLPFPHGDGQTLLREALLLADHNAYHIGQLVLLRRLLGAWKD